MIGKHWTGLMVMRRYNGNLKEIYICLLTRNKEKKCKCYSSEEEGSVDDGAADERV